MKRRIISLGVTLVAGMILTGCATDSSNSENTDIRKQLYELQKVQGAQASRLEELNNKILLLKDKVDAKSDSVTGNNELPLPPLQQTAKTPQQIQKSMAPVPSDVSSDDQASENTQEDEKESVQNSQGAEDTSPTEPTVELRDAHPSSTQGASSNSGNAERIYDRAVIDAKKAQLGALEKDVVQLLKNHKESPLANNGLFLFAETLFARGQFSKSAIQYERLYKLFPDGNKAVASLYQLGICYEKLGRKSEAKEALQNVMTVYPGSREAIQAEKILNTSGDKGT